MWVHDGIQLVELSYPQADGFDCNMTGYDTQKHGMRYTMSRDTIHRHGIRYTTFTGYDTRDSRDTVHRFHGIRYTKKLNEMVCKPYAARLAG